ncbi:MAG: hypothetical protein RLZZ77_1561 [Bacteroidota bacterium]
MNFLKNVLASMLGTFLALVIATLFFVILIVGLVASAGETEHVAIKDYAILHLQLDDQIVDRASESDFNFNGSSFESTESIGLNDFIADLKHAATDEKIKGIFLEVGNIGGAPSSMLDLRQAISDFKKSGKWIIAYSENYSQGGYFIASAANEVYLYPTGSLDWRGINAEVMFYKKLIDKLEIEAQIIRGPNNKFKSAVEPFMYDKMSEPNREQMKTFIDDIWKVMLEHIATDRDISTAVLNSAADSLSTINPKNAVSMKMIDGLKYRDEIMDIMKSRVESLNMSADGTDKKDELNLVSLSDYHSTYTDISLAKESVAVVYAVGSIESGEGDDQTIGSDRIAKALKEAREDETVKAIVLRVNSPGGSALASDVIWRETELIKKSGKPLIVSMGDYAASGGYYISCSADKIFANPNTITGSIGVFGILPNMQRFLDNKLGITFDRYETNPHADYISVNKPLEAYEMTAMQNSVTQIYDDFTLKVATGRKKTQAEIDSIGQGRVWSGEDALTIGLVDKIGNLQDAIAAAAEMAKLTEYQVDELPKMIDPFEKLLTDLTGQKQASVMQELLGESYVAYRDVKSLVNMRGPQVRLPFILKIQ